MNSHTILGRLCVDAVYRTSFFANPVQTLKDFPVPLLGPEQDGLEYMTKDLQLAGQLKAKFEEIDVLLHGVGCTNPPCPWPKYYMVVPPTPPNATLKG